MKYISAQPDELFYAWQVEVMLDNFLEVGIDPDDIHIIVGIKKHIGIWWRKLIEKYNKVGFFFYEDGRTLKDYPPSIRLYLLSQHWTRYKELRDETIFYHDCDILFTKTPDFSKFVNDDIWYLSDAHTYIGAQYVRSKGEYIYECMTEIIGIDKTIPIKREYESGGAQYLMKKVTTYFWYQSYLKSENIYRFLKETGTGIQAWTADMWTILWFAWAQGYQTKVDPYFKFSMATDTWPKWDTNLIYHNAGVVADHKDKLFNKNDFRGSLPYQSNNPYNDDFCSYYYFEQVIKTGNTSCLVERIPDYQDLVRATKNIFIPI